MSNENEGVEFEQDDDAVIDFTEVEEDKGFECLPKGKYNVIVDEAEAKKSQSSGNPMISLTLVIEDGEYQGRKLFTHVVFSPKTLGQAKRTINRLGLGELLTSTFRPNQDAADQFIGKRAQAVVAIQKYEGEDRNSVKNLLPPAGESDEFLNSDD